MGNKQIENDSDGTVKKFMGAIAENTTSKSEILILISATVGGGILGATLGTGIGMLIGGPIGATILFILGFAYGLYSGIKWGKKLNSNNED